MSEFNAHLSARGAMRRNRNSSSTNNSAPGPLHADIDEPPKPWPFAPFIALLILIFLCYIQFWPATHYRHPSDPRRQWHAISRSPEMVNQARTDNSTQTEPLDYVHIFSWSDDSDLRPLAVLVNSTISSSRNPGNIYFYLFLPDYLEVEPSHRKLMTLFPKSNISIHRHSVIREKVKVFASEGENSISDFQYFLPFYIPKIFQNIRRFIYLAPDIVVKGKVEDLFQVKITNSPVAAVEDCSQYFEVIEAMQRAYASPGVDQEPYRMDTCILDLSVLLVNAELLVKEDFTKVTKLWREVHHIEGDRDHLSAPAIMLALSGNYTKLDDSWNVRESKFSGTGSDVKIFHFDGEKPWSKRAEGSEQTNITKIWWDYLSPLADQFLTQPIV